MIRCPGLALLQLARGDGRGRRGDDSAGRCTNWRLGPRPALLSGAVEIFRSTGDFVAARCGCRQVVGDRRPVDVGCVARRWPRRPPGRYCSPTGDAPAALAELRTAGANVADAAHAVRRGEGLCVAGSGVRGAGRPDQRRDGIRQRQRNFHPAGRDALTWTVWAPCRPDCAEDAERETSLSAREQEVLDTPGGGAKQPRDRRATGGQPAHRRPPCRAHLRQAGGHQPHRGQPRTRTSTTSSDHGSFDPIRMQMGRLADAASASAFLPSWPCLQCLLSPLHRHGGRELSTRLRSSHRHTGVARIASGSRLAARASESSMSRAGRAWSRGWPPSGSAPAGTVDGNRYRCGHDRRREVGCPRRTRSTGTSRTRPRCPCPMLGGRCPVPDGPDVHGEQAVAIAEMRRVLAPSGRVVITTPGANPTALRGDGAGDRRADQPGPGRLRQLGVLHARPRDRRRTASARRGLHDVSASVSTTTFRLPLPAEFLWQYINLTPMAALIGKPRRRRRRPWRGSSSTARGARGRRCARSSNSRW